MFGGVQNSNHVLWRNPFSLSVFSFSVISSLRTMQICCMNLINLKMLCSTKLFNTECCDIALVDSTGCTIKVIEQKPYIDQSLFRLSVHVLHQNDCATNN